MYSHVNSVRKVESKISVKFIITITKLTREILHMPIRSLRHEDDERLV